jgi:hypothetical protein
MVCLWQHFADLEAHFEHPPHVFFSIVEMTIIELWPRLPKLVHGPQFGYHIAGVVFRAAEAMSKAVANFRLSCIWSQSMRVKPPTMRTYDKRRDTGSLDKTDNGRG